jgi:hypothetical protein
LNRYETAFQILHKLRAGMVRPGRDRIGGQPRDHVEIDESWPCRNLRAKSDAKETYLFQYVTNATRL